MPSKYLSKLKGKSVLVVGGSSGIGYGVAEGSLEHGAHVVIASRSQSKVDAAVEKLKAAWPEHAANIRGHTVNLNTRETDTEAELVKLFDFATDNGTKPLDHLVETAGDLEMRGKLTLETVTPELMGQAQAVRIVGVILLAKVAARYINKTYTSSLTLTSGALMYRPMKGFSAFLAASGGKEPTTRGLALDMAPVRVNLISPGAIETDLLYAHIPPGMTREALTAMYAKGSILNRVGEVEDVAEAYLAIMKNYFQTGSVVHVEGGYLLS